MERAFLRELVGRLFGSWGGRSLEVGLTERPRNKIELTILDESIGIGYSYGVCRETEGARTCLQIGYSYGVCEKYFRRN
jgi:hypothetical protein